MKAPAAPHRARLLLLAAATPPATPTLQPPPLTRPFRPALRHIAPSSRAARPTAPPAPPAPGPAPPGSAGSSTLRRQSGQRQPVWRMRDSEDGQQAAAHTVIKRFEVDCW